ncbi:MAG: hypothetical protein NDI94_03430, partial [Candidatus Woesearchaeota archaeon]|nr:hypothetical protein [Candidatus Woesearchaeota archaeon]
MSFTFNVNGKDFTVPEQTREILGKAKDEFVFKLDECAAGDTKSGNYNLIAAPTKRECKYEQYPRNVTKTILEEKQVNKERIVEKEETLLQSILGTNKEDKV